MFPGGAVPPAMLGLGGGEWGNVLTKTTTSLTSRPPPTLPYSWPTSSPQRAIRAAPSLHGSPPSPSAVISALRGTSGEQRPQHRHQRTLVSTPPLPHPPSAAPVALLPVPPPHVSAQVSVGPAGQPRARGWCRGRGGAAGTAAAPCPPRHPSDS